MCLVLMSHDQFMCHVTCHLHTSETFTWLEGMIKRQHTIQNIESIGVTIVIVCVSLSQLCYIMSASSLTIRFREDSAKYQINLNEKPNLQFLA